MRPVLLTSLNDVLGLSPMIFMINIDLIRRDVSIGSPSTQWWVDLSIAITGGLVFATFLTLLLTPSMLVLGDRSARFWNTQVRGAIARLGAVGARTTRRSDA